MSFWERVKKDVQKSFSEGMAVIREKTEWLTEEGKKKYRAFDLKNRVHQYMADLGGLVYSLSSKAKNPMEDSRVKSLVDKIRKYEDQIKKLESAAEKKKAAKKKGAKKTQKKTTKKTVKKATAKKTAGAKKE